MRVCAFSGTERRNVGAAMKRSDAVKHGFVGANCEELLCRLVRLSAELKS